MQKRMFFFVAILLIKTNHNNNNNKTICTFAQLLMNLIKFKKKINIQTTRKPIHK